MISSFKFQIIGFQISDYKVCSNADLKQCD